MIASTLSTPLVVRGPYGFGRVTVVGMDVNAPPFSDWPDRGLFFVKALDLKGTNTAVNPTNTSMRIISSGVSDLATLIRRSLDQFKGVTLIPFGWVAGFIVVYILLIGPGDYFFLKKVLKRMELTWITFPTIVITVSMLAYYAAYVVKGTDLRVNKIDVVDIDVEQNLARGTSWINLFSPQNRDYSVSVVPQPPDRAPSTDSKVSSTLAPGTEVLLTWFGAPENGLRGMNTRGQGLGFGGGYSYGPVGKAEELEDVRVGIWSTKGFVARWSGPAPASSVLLESDLQTVGTDRLAGTITNRLPIPLKDTIIAFGKQVYYKIGKIEAWRDDRDQRHQRPLPAPFARAIPPGKPQEVHAGELLHERRRVDRPCRAASRDDVPRQRHVGPGVDPQAGPITTSTCPASSHSAGR